MPLPHIDARYLGTPETATGYYHRPSIQKLASKVHQACGSPTYTIKLCDITLYCGKTLKKVEKYLTMLLGEEEGDESHG